MCEDDEADALVEALLRSAATGRIGDGKIWVTPIDQADHAPTVSGNGTA